MKQDKFSRPMLLLYACGILPVIWLALLLAPSLGGGKFLGKEKRKFFKKLLTTMGKSAILSLALFEGRDTAA